MLNVATIILGEHTYKNVSKLASSLNNAKYSELPWAKDSSSPEYLMFHIQTSVEAVNQLGYPASQQNYSLLF